MVFFNGIIFNVPQKDSMMVCLYTCSDSDSETLTFRGFMNGSSEKKKLLTQLQKIIKEDTYTGYQIGFGELVLFFDLAS